MANLDSLTERSAVFSGGIADHDIPEGGSGDDTLAGGDGGDVIDLSGLEGISGFEDLHIRSNGNHTLN